MINDAKSWRLGGLWSVEHYYLSVQCARDERVRGIMCLGKAEMHTHRSAAHFYDDDEEATLIIGSLRTITMEAHLLPEP